MKEIHRMKCAYWDGDECDCDHIDDRVGTKINPTFSYNSSQSAYYMQGRREGWWHGGIAPGGFASI